MSRFRVYDRIYCEKTSSVSKFDRRDNCITEIQIDSDGYVKITQTDLNSYSKSSIDWFDGLLLFPTLDAVMNALTKKLDRVATDLMDRMSKTLQPSQRYKELNKEYQEVLKKIKALRDLKSAMQKFLSEYQSLFVYKD